MRGIGRFGAALLTVVLVASMIISAPADAGATAVVITEVYYNPPGQQEGDQFVELHNASDMAIDMSGWAFSDGVDLVFPPGSVIPARGWYAIAAEAAAFEASFSRPPDAVFAGGLSNGGERIALTTDTAMMVDQIVYDDTTPWPIEADGDGSSLQLLDVVADNADALSWGIGTPSPGAANDGAVAPGTASPTFALGRGVYDGPILEEVTSVTPGAVVHYTVNGQRPTASSLVWSGEKALSSDGGALQHVRAIAIAPGRDESAEVSATYLFPAALPFSAGLDQLATISLSYDSGSYIRCENFAGECPRNAVSVEMLDPAGDGFGVTAAVAPFGSSSLQLGKNHLRLYFDSEWGPSNLEYPVFDGFGRGFIEPTEKFDKLELKAQGYEGYDSRFFPYPYYISDRYWKDTMLDMGSLHPHGRVVNVFVNGQYWGVFDLRERFDPQFAASYRGQPAEDYEFIRADESAWNQELDVKQGLGNLWPALKVQSWAQVSSFVDARQLIRHEITTSVQDHQNLVGGGGGENEYRMLAIPGAQESIVMYSDNDVSFGQESGVSTSSRRFWWIPERGASNPQFQWSIRFAEESDEFRAIVLEETERAFCGAGALTLDRALARFDDATATMRLAIAGEQWRWGGNSTNFELAIANGRARLASGIPELHQGWSDHDLFNGCAAATIESGEGLVINEVHYNPQPGLVDGISIDGDLYEFVELHNTTDRTMKIAGFTFLNGIDYTFDDSATVIEAGGYYVIASSADDFAARYGFEPQATYRGGLDNGGETVTLVNTAGAIVDTVSWDDAGAWPVAADGAGPSLELISPDSDNALAESWRASAQSGGTPGAVNETSLEPVGDVNCDTSLSDADALSILQYGVASRTAATCPLSDPGLEIALALADVNGDGNVNILDALLVSQCAASIDNGVCPSG